MFFFLSNVIIQLQLVYLESPFSLERPLETQWHVHVLIHHFFSACRLILHSQSMEFHKLEFL